MAVWRRRRWYDDEDDDDDDGDVTVVPFPFFFPMSIGEEGFFVRPVPFSPSGGFIFFEATNLYLLINSEIRWGGTQDNEDDVHEKWYPSSYQYQSIRKCLSFSVKIPCEQIVLIA